MGSKVVDPRIEELVNEFAGLFEGGPLQVLQKLGLRKVLDRELARRNRLTKGGGDDQDHEG